MYADMKRVELGRQDCLIKLFDEIKLMYNVPIHETYVKAVREYYKSDPNDIDITRIINALLGYLKIKPSGINRSKLDLRTLKLLAMKRLLCVHGLHIKHI